MFVSRFCFPSASNAQQPSKMQIRPDQNKYIKEKEKSFCAEFERIAKHFVIINKDDNSYISMCVSV